MTAPTSRTADPASIVAQMRPVLIAYFRRRCGDLAEAEDLAQDVLVRVLAHTNWQSEEEAKGYIFRAAVNRWRDRGRRLLTHPETVEWNDEMLGGRSEERTPEALALAQEEVQQVTLALAELNERPRDVLILFKLEQMKIVDIADRFGISVSAVNKHLARALAHLGNRCARIENAS